MSILINGEIAGGKARGLMEEKKRMIQREAHAFDFQK